MLVDHELARIYNKPDEYVICLECETFYYFLNKKCHQCGERNNRNVLPSDVEKELNKQKAIHREKYANMDIDALMTAIRIKIA